MEFILEIDAQAILEHTLLTGSKTLATSFCNVFAMAVHLNKKLTDKKSDK
jgi:hypothetical protein